MILGAGNWSKVQCKGRWANALPRHIPLLDVETCVGLRPGLGGNPSV